MDFNRRSFLKAAGVSLLLPRLESEAGENDHRIKNLFCVSLNFGVHPGHFFPQDNDPCSSKVLAALKDNEADISVLLNTQHPYKGGHGAVHGFLSGNMVGKAKDLRDKNISIDQKFVNETNPNTRFQSLQLAMGGAGGMSQSWNQKGEPLRNNYKLESIYESLFVEPSKKGRELRRKILANKSSVMDFVFQQAGTMKRFGTKRDAEIIDEYMDGVRGVEKRITTSKSWIDVPKPKVDYKIPRDPISNATNLKEYYELIRLAFMTDQTRVITLGIPANPSAVPIDGVNIGYHSLTHHGNQPERLNQLYLIDSHNMKCFNDFMSKMKNTKAADGSSLYERSAMIYGSGMGDANNHSNRRLPVILSGGLLKPAGVLDLKDRNLSDVYVSILNKLDVNVDKFGSSKGNINDLI
ncbi:DUF1552 domain-containing protein [Lentisphaera profundi]|uniref:DUF1552 domain-containing protein n=1 Tax=Lentisphaera profundi TaxID=1658616 RepID=A0ABY7VQN3_9BACT|nr:DUF1552 domain-containing protein [Lentisphaera profundi]WDE96501.1 DUF1552 domain-containing protein [Lentisphaera profundi]